MAKQYTDEERAAAAERMRKARAAKKAAAEAAKAEESKRVTYDEETVQRMINEALEKQRMTFQAQPQVIQIQQDVEKVTMLWQAPVADYNTLLIGENGMFGRITGSTGVAYVPKPELSRVLDEKMRWFIDNRWMLILDGLNDEEREALHCKYEDGEVLTQNQFRNIEKLGDQLLEIFPKLCKQHQQMVAQRIAECYINKTMKFKRDMMVSLNEMSKANFGGGLFVGVIERMNQAELGK